MKRDLQQTRDTKERILDAAEQLFADFGFAGTSLRGITTLAGVNLAAVNYHFGSKDSLIESVFARRLGPLNAERLAGLDELESRAHRRTPDRSDRWIRPGPMGPMGCAHTCHAPGPAEDPGAVTLQAIAVEVLAMKAMIESYRSFPGEHCGSSAMRGLLHHYCGLELPEVAVFGLGAGIDCVYLAGPTLDPAALVFGRTVGMELDLCRALGVDYREQPEADDAEAWETVREEVLMPLHYSPIGFGGAFRLPSLHSILRTS